MKMFIYRQGDEDIAIVTAEDLSEANSALKNKSKTTTFFVKLKDPLTDDVKLEVYELSTDIVDYW